MSLFDNIIGAAATALGGDAQQGTALQLVMQLVEKSGGIDGLLQTLQQNGLDAVLQSWIGSGSNAAVSGAQLESALGSQLLGEAAAKVGVSGSEAGNLLAQYLPQIIDQITPNGQAGDVAGVDLGSIGGALLKNLFK